MSLYNMKKLSPDVEAYRMVKFDDHLNVEKVYELNFKRKWHCNCEAYQRPTCRHREMAPLFIKARKVNSEFFYCYEKEEWSL